MNEQNFNDLEFACQLQKTISSKLQLMSIECDYIEQKDECIDMQAPFSDLNSSFQVVSIVAYDPKTKKMYNSQGLYVLDENEKTRIQNLVFDGNETAAICDNDGVTNNVSDIVFCKENYGDTTVKGLQEAEKFIKQNSKLFNKKMFSIKNKTKP